MTVTIRIYLMLHNSVKCYELVKQGVIWSKMVVVFQTEKVFKAMQQNLLKWIIMMPLFIVWQRKISRNTMLWSINQLISTWRRDCKVSDLWIRKAKSKITNFFKAIYINTQIRLVPINCLWMCHQVNSQAKYFAGKIVQRQLQISNKDILFMHIFLYI